MGGDGRSGAVRWARRDGCVDQRHLRGPGTVGGRN